MKRSDLIGIEVVVNNIDEANQFSRLCSDYGIYQGDWPGCSYTNGTMRGLVSLDKGTNDSCKLVFTPSVPIRTSSTTHAVNQVNGSIVSSATVKRRQSRYVHAHCTPVTH